MEVAQISIFLENRTGGLADVFEVLSRSEIDVKALSLADMSDFGILRLVVDDPERTRRILKDAGFTVDKTRVVAVEVPDRPGGLLETLLALRRNGINVEYMYSVARRSGEPRHDHLPHRRDRPRARRAARGRDHRARAPGH